MRDMEGVYQSAELIVAKQRHGATGKVRLKFDSRVTKFSDAADENYLPEMRANRGRLSEDSRARVAQLAP